jgi:mono/diheme cytochrome c family protein
MKRVMWVVVCGLFFLLASISQVPGQASKRPEKTPELLAQAKKLYDQNCVMCHGPKGDGKGQLGVALKPPPNDFTKPLGKWPYSKGDQKKVFDAITNGVPNTPMVKWSQLPEKDRWGLVYLVLEFAPASKK